MKKLLLILLFFCVLVNVSYSQDLGERLQKVGSNYAKIYLQPFADALGTNLNSNYFYNANVPFDKKKPVDFHIGIRIRFMNTFLSSDDQKFNFSYTDTAVVSGTPVVGTYVVQNAPTVIGESDPAIAKFYYNGTYYPGNDLTLIGGVVKTTSIPLAMPEIMIGSVYGTDATISLLPAVNISDFGKFSFFGFTIRHNLSHYFKDSPVDFAIQGGYQGMALTESNNNDLWKSTNFFINGQVSKTYKFVTGYAALQYEKYKADVSYNYIDNGVKYPIAFTLDGNNNFRGVLGFSLKAGFFVWNFDVNVGKRVALSSGFNFAIM